MWKRSIYTIANQQLDWAAKRLTVKWNTKNMEIIFGWLMIRDINEELCNWFLYLRRNKAKATRQLPTDMKLGETKLKVTKKKIQDKIKSMVAIFKT